MVVVCGVLSQFHSKLVLPPSDEGGGKTAGFDGGREKKTQFYLYVSPSVSLTLDSSLVRGSQDRTITKDTILVYTYRSKAQGGLGEHSAEMIRDIHQVAAETKVPDFIDVEYFAEEKAEKEIRSLLQSVKFVWR